MMHQLQPLFDHLAQRVMRVRPAPAPQLDVGELLDTFAPYRAVRVACAVESAEDYEVLVMRLLAGEGGLIFADEVMQDDFKSQLASGNPDLRVLRSYRGTRVTLSKQGVERAMAAAATSADAAAPEPEPIAPTVAPTAAPEPEPEPRVTPPPPPAEPDATGGTPEARAGSTLSTFELVAEALAAPPSCGYCSCILPAGRPVTFCPFCGQNLRVRRCVACSSEIEAGWKFCVTCGRTAD